ncbi:MAG: hypothetical protein M3081_13965 [Gemmatimonadota bacterium]|nr:hypothetical protein [Gemmatimonadota bacterium]
MTLIEVMLALGMVAFAAMSSARYSAGFAHAVVTESGRAQASDLVAQRLEDITAATDYDGLESSFGASEQIAVGGATYTRLTVLRHIGGGVSDLDDYKVVTVIVSGGGLLASIQSSIVIAQF